MPAKSNSVYSATKAAVLADPREGFVSAKASAIGPCRESARYLPTLRPALERLKFVYSKGIGYAYQMGLRPQTLYGIADSPVGVAGYFLDHDARSYALIMCVFDGASEGLPRDDILDNITITWLTNTFVSGARLTGKTSSRISAPRYLDPGCRERVSRRALSMPPSWAERAYPKLIYYNKQDKGGHFAAWEQPQRLTEDLRAGFRSLR